MFKTTGDRNISVSQTGVTKITYDWQVTGVPKHNSADSKGKNPFKKHDRRHKGRLVFGSRQPARSFRGGRKLRFFGRAIFDQFWSSTAPRCASLWFHDFFIFFDALPPPAHFGDLELTGTKNKGSLNTCLATKLTIAYKIRRPNTVSSTKRTPPDWGNTAECMRMLWLTSHRF